MIIRTVTTQDPAITSEYKLTLDTDGVYEVIQVSSGDIWGYFCPLMYIDFTEWLNAPYGTQVETVTDVIVEDH
jgi:hypothetical protein